MNGAALIEGATFVKDRAWEYASSTTSVFNRARSLVAGDAQFFSVAPRVDDLRRSLASEELQDKRDSMKRIVAQMCKGTDMRHFFPDVVKNIHVPSIELRKLIYLFIVHYAEDCPNEALLSISAFEKDLRDQSMHVRSLALRMLAALRIPAIQPVVMVAVKKCGGDMAPVVRKTSALALIQMHHVARQELDLDGAMQLLRTLLMDRSPDVVGAAALAYTVVCPGAWDVVHPVFRRLCRVLKDCEAHGQVVLLRLLLRYARLYFVDPTGPFAGAAKTSGDASSEGEKSKDGSGTDSDADDATSSSSGFGSHRGSEADAATRAGAGDADAKMDADLLLLLNAASPLLHSMNSAVVIEVIALYTHCGTPRFQEACAKPAMRLLNTSTEGQIAILHVIYTLLRTNVEAFRPYIKSFFVFPMDPADVRQMKLRVLAHLVTQATAADVFREFRAYVRQWNEAAVVESVQGLALVVQHYPPFATHTIRLITPLLRSNASSPAVVAEAVTVLRVLTLQGTDAVRISRLVCRLTLDVMEERITEPSAVATVLWLAGENISRHASMAAAAPDCFRVFAKRFGSLTAEVKRQVLTLGCKIWIHLQGSSDLAERFKKIFFYVAELARYDDDYSIRDEERLLSTILDRQSDTFAAVRTALLRAKPLPDPSDPQTERGYLELGSYAQLLGPSVRGAVPLPEWATVPSSPTLRRSVEEMSAAAAAAAIIHTSTDDESGSESERSYSTSASEVSDAALDSASSSGESEDGSSYSGSSVDGSAADSSNESGSSAASSSLRRSQGTATAPAKVAVKVVMQRALAPMADSTVGSATVSSPAPAPDLASSVDAGAASVRNALEAAKEMDDERGKSGRGETAPLSPTE